MSTTDSALPRTTARRAGAAPVVRVLTSEYLVLGLTVAYFAVLSAVVPAMASLSTLQDMLGSLIPLLIVATGQTFVLIVAGIDLSASAILAVASVVGASMMTADGGLALASGVPIVIALLAFLCVGALIGAFNGFCSTRLNMPSFIVTLATMMFFTGFALLYTASMTTSGNSFGDLPAGFLTIGEGTFAGLPHSLVLAVVVAGGAHFLLTRTVFGRWLYAIGQNPQAAAISGVPVRRAITWAFVISGVCAAIAAILYTGRLETGTPVLGQDMLLDIIGAPVIGGVSLFGGRGKVSWTLYGVLFLTVVDKGLQLLGLTFASVMLIKGVVILLAAGLDAMRQFLAQRA